MKKISSRNTFFYKRVFPMIWFGFLAVFLLTSLIAFLAKGNVPVAFLIIPIGMAIFGYFLMRVLVFDLMDEVWDEGTTLLVRNKNMEERIYFKNIKDLSYSVMTNPNRVTLSLRTPCQFGNKVSFSPPTSWVPFGKNKDIVKLIDKVGKLRNGQQPHEPDAE